MDTGLNKQNMFMKSLSLQDLTLTENFAISKLLRSLFPIKNDKKNTHVYLLLVELNKKSHTCSTSV